MMAPVVGSGSWPAWMARVSKRMAGGLSHSPAPREWRAHPGPLQNACRTAGTRRRGSRGCTGEDRAAMTTADQGAVGMFENRLRKNARHLRKWAKARGLTAFRVYDRDVPEY